MSMGTPLQSAYDSFILKVDEDLTGKESLIYNLLKVAISKAYKHTPHSLNYTLTSETTFAGVFDDTLIQDEIELISLNMDYEHKRRKQSYLLGLKRENGTKDFNATSKKPELDGVQNSMQLLKDEIKELQQQFNTYTYS